MKENYYINQECFYKILDVFGLSHNDGADISNIYYDKTIQIRMEVFFDKICDIWMNTDIKDKKNIIDKIFDIIELV